MSYSDDVVEVLSRRITDEDIDLAEVAQAIIDVLRLREEWTWQTETGIRGYELSSRREVEDVIGSISPSPGILSRLVTDWNVETG